MNDNRPTPEKPTRRSHKSSMHHDWRWWKPKESASTAVTEDSYEDDDDDEEESGKGIDDYQDDQVSLLFGTAMLGRTIPKQRRPPHRWLEGWAARLWNQHWFPPGPWKLGQEQIQAPAVQFFKFFVVSIGSLIVIHYYAKIVVRKISSNLKNRVFLCAEKKISSLDWNHSMFVYLLLER